MAPPSSRSISRILKRQVSDEKKISSADMIHGASGRRNFMRRRAVSRHTMGVGPDTRRAVMEVTKKRSTIMKSLSTEHHEEYSLRMVSLGAIPTMSEQFSYSCQITKRNVSSGSSITSTNMSEEKDSQRERSSSRRKSRINKWRMNQRNELLE